MTSGHDNIHAVFLQADRLQLKILPCQIPRRNIFSHFHLTSLANIASTVHVQLIMHQYDGRKVLSRFFEAFQLFCNTLAPY